MNVGDVAIRDMVIRSRWCKIAYIGIVQLIAGQMECSLEIWESSTYDPSDRADFYQRILRRRITQTALQGGEYGEVIPIPMPYYDRDVVDEERTYRLHVRLVNEIGGTVSDFAVSFKIADIGEHV